MAMIFLLIHRISSGRRDHHNWVSASTLTRSSPSPSTPSIWDQNLQLCLGLVGDYIDDSLVRLRHRLDNVLLEAEQHCL